QDNLVDAAAHHGQQHQRHQDGGKAQDEVDDAHQHGVDEAAYVGSHQPGHAADGGGQAYRRQAHHQADAQAVQNGAEHVAALVVGAQQVNLAVHRGGAWRQAAVEQVQVGEVVGVVRREEQI